MPNRIDAILFDFNGTLRRKSKREENEKIQIAAEILKILDSDQDPRVFVELLSEREKYFKKWAHNTNVGINELEVWKKWLLPELPEEQVCTHAIQFDRIWRNAKNTWEPSPSIEKVIVELFGRGYRLGLVSNSYNRFDIPHTLEDWGISGYFETILLSCDFGIRKPDPAILLAAAERMKTKPENCAYIGNRPESDVVSSRKAGFSISMILSSSNQPASKTQDPNFTPDRTVDDLTELLDVFVRPKKFPKKELEPVYDISLSSMWGIKKFSSLKDFCTATLRMGYKYIELNHQVNSSMLESLDLKQYSFSSVHEPCPYDLSVDIMKERDWLLSSLDENNRRQGLDAIKQSIDFAAKINSSVVVVHCGHMPGFRKVEDGMRAMFQPGASQTGDYINIKKHLQMTRADVFGSGFEMVKKSIRELLDHAARSRICLGLENRYHFMEFPSPDDLEELLNLGTPDRIGFVYDVGHAQALDRLGFFPAEEWLERFATRIVEIHLHDVRGITDHLAPGLGEVNFKKIARYLPAHAIRTVEVGHHNSVEQLRSGLRVLVESGCVNLV